MRWRSLFPHADARRPTLSPASASAKAPAPRPRQSRWTGASSAARPRFSNTSPTIRRGLCAGSMRASPVCAGAVPAGVCRRAQQPQSRPTPDEWKRALTRFRGELTRCAHDPTHYFWRANASCPYCEADNRYAGKASAVLRGPAAAPSPAAASAAHCSSPSHARSHARCAARARHGAHVRLYAARRRRPGPGGPGRVRLAAARFWALTILLSMAVLAALCDGVLPQMYDSIANNALVTRIGTARRLYRGLRRDDTLQRLLGAGAALGALQVVRIRALRAGLPRFHFGFGLVMGAGLPRG